MKLITKTITLDNKEEPLTIIPMGDLHIGAKGFNKQYFENTIEWIKNKENCYVIGMGDMLDCIVMKDKRFDIKSIDEYFIKSLDNLPMTQLQYLKDVITPIKDRILCMIPGNHEDKFRTEHSVDIMSELNGSLGIDIGDYMTFLRIKPDKSQFHTTDTIFWLNHGWFGGRKSGGKVNQLQDIGNSYEANIYLAAHSHDLFCITSEKLYYRGNSVVKEKKIFGNTGTFLETVHLDGTSYSEKKAYPLSKIGILRFDIYLNKKPRPDIHVRI